MIVYIIMVLISIAFLFLQRIVPKKWQKVTCFILAGLPFFLVSALRYRVGTDYHKRYVNNFNGLLRGGSPDDLALEIGFYILLKLCSFITYEYAIIFIVTSAIIIGFFMYTMFDKSKNPILSVLIFFLAGFFFDSLNIMRQYLAMSIVIFGYRFLLKEKKYYFAYALCVLIATSMHASAILMLALLVFTKKMLVSPIWVLPCAAVVLILNENLLSLLAVFIQNTRFVPYLTNEFAQGEVSFLFIGENLAFYLLMYYIYKKNQKLGVIRIRR